ncbi:FBD domain-containing protein [Heracleum sosnowskyi]|uniref:FBD domain-containing protein n=1 Tax=Heracleum sosnowskyi TaxID=360622 RepID=A0AAD8MTT3_9APIA|nr:FBD domain-containing protein [Heracleum sosnowskyi]
MASKRSKTKRSKTSSTTDRISDLPDLLLLTILSFLPFHSAVSTSLLSKRWRPLCMSLSNLHFDDSDGEKSGPPFISRVDKFLMNRENELVIEEFGLKCNGDYDRTLVNTWIHKALELQVKNVSLELCIRGGLYQLLPDMYTYGRFEVLRLKWRILVDIPSNFYFSRLKVLEFYYVQFSSYESVTELLLNCPVLESLVIQRCKYQSGCCLTVCGSALKNLTLKTAEGNDQESKLKIVIDTPALETLKVGDSAFADIFVKDTLLSLRTAHFSVGIDRDVLRESLFRLLDNSFHVESLTLTDKAVGALDGDTRYGLSIYHNVNCGSDYEFPIFHNLIKLELRVDNWTCWKLLPKILASSPNLQTLLLPWGVDLGHTSQRHDYCLWSWPRPVPECLLSNLKTIEYGAFHGTNDELSLFEFLILHGRALQKISIDCSDLKRKSKIRKELLTYGRGSQSCKIEFIN